MNQQASTLRKLLSPRHGRDGLARAATIAVAGGRAGVGTSTLATNLAVALRLQGLRVALVGLARARAPRPPLEHVLEGRREAADVVLDGPEGVRLVATGAGLEQLANLTPWQQARLWQGFARLDAEADLVLVEAPAGAVPGALHVLAAAPDTVVVTTPEPAAVADAYALVKQLARRRPDGALHLAVNRARSAQEAHAAAARVARVARRFLGRSLHSLGFVLEDPALGQAARQRAPVVAAHGGSPAARCLRAMAARLSRVAGRPTAPSLAECMRAAAALQSDHLASRREL